MPRLLETETTIPPAGGIFLSKGLVRQETLDFAERYDDILADAAAAREQLKLGGIFSTTPEGLRQHQKLVQEYFGLCGDPELLPPQLERKAKLERLLGKRDELMRRIGLAEDVTRVIRRNSEQIVQDFKRHNRAGYHQLGHHIYWLVEHEYALGERQLFFRCDHPREPYSLVYFGDDALPVTQPGKPAPKFPLSLAPHRLASTRDRIDLLHDTLEAAPFTRQTESRPAPMSEGELRILRLMGELVVPKAEVECGADTDGNHHQPNGI
ncbi:MAG TPA: hypothetical protein VG992_03750 [Candidatus Saccharimonadales bacterium]|nr:hypothetical protein [Candidatus Saccharimonadales bacterium]